MTDTVKLIIEIPKERELIDKAIWYDISDFDTEDLAIILTALKNGVPLDDVKALEQEPCEDCISRAEVINAISHAELSFQVESDLNFENYKREVQEIADGILKGQVKAISDLASVQPKPKTGHWEQYGNSWEDKFKCSECGKEQPKILCGERLIGHWSDYCPNCGAKMLPTDSEKE